MTQLDTGTRVRQGKANPNVYTVLAIIATVMLAVGVGYLWKTNGDLASNITKGSESSPFYMVETGQ